MRLQTFIQAWFVRTLTIFLDITAMNLVRISAASGATIVRKTLRGIALFVLVAVLTVACAANIQGEQQVFSSKASSWLDAWRNIYETPALSFEWYDTSVNVTLRDYESNVEYWKCTYKLNNAMTAWLRIGPSEYCPGSVSVP